MFWYECSDGHPPIECEWTLMIERDGGRPCPECGERMEFKCSANVAAFTVNFKPYYSRAHGCMVNSKAERDALIAKSRAKYEERGFQYHVYEGPGDVNREDEKPFFGPPTPRD